MSARGVGGFFFKCPDAAAARMRAAGEPVVGEVRVSEEGRVAWVLDPDGQKLELWEPSGTNPYGSQDGGVVSGIGGVFFRTEDPKSRKAWYATHLGIEPGDDGYVSFRSKLSDGSTGHTAWEIFPADTTYFDSDDTPNPHPFMINFRVNDLEDLLERLRGADVWVDPKTEAFEYGKFGWIVDPQGARIELWEPTPDPF